MRQQLRPILLGTGESPWPTGNGGLPRGVVTLCRSATARPCVGEEKMYTLS
jgi:hypothetical protein